MRCDWVVDEPGRPVKVPPPPRPAPDPEDVVVVYLSLGAQDDLDEWSERLPAVWDRGCLLWEPMTVPLAHSLPSPQDIPRDHHGAGSPRSR